MALVQSMEAPSPTLQQSSEHLDSNYDKDSNTSDQDYFY